MTDTTCDIPNPYAVLGVPFDATASEIKQAFLEDPSTPKRMAAYATLSNPQTRAAVDHRLLKPIDSRSPRADSTFVEYQTWGHDGAFAASLVELSRLGVVFDGDSVPYEDVPTSRTYHESVTPLPMDEVVDWDIDAMFFAGARREPVPGDFYASAIADLKGRVMTCQVYLFESQGNWHEDGYIAGMPAVKSAHEH